MEWINNFNALLIIIGFAVIYYTAKNLLPSYFGEKGKNIATKEDIEEITTLVEQVKHSFTKETEYLKANLGLLTNIHSNLISEERAAIIDYNDKYFSWLNKLIDSSLGDADKFNNSDLEMQSKMISDSYRDLSSSETRFTLFVENETLLSSASKMKLQTLELMHSEPFECIHNLQSNNRNWEKLASTLSKEDYEKEHALYLERFTAITKKFRDSIIAHFKIIHPLNKSFQKQCREHLYSLVQSEKKEKVEESKK